MVFLTCDFLFYRNQCVNCIVLTRKDSVHAGIRYVIHASKFRKPPHLFVAVGLLPPLFFFFFRACYSRKWRSGPRQAISTTPLRPHICRVPTSPFPVKAKEIPGSKYRGLSSRFITYHEL
jgi:hypothetical protein